MNEDLKRAAARAAIEELPVAGVIGLGTGTTAGYFVEALSEAIRAGRELVGVPTSEATREQALGLGIPLLDDAGPWAIGVTVDGADEVGPDLDLIKGAGGALLREKIISFSSQRTIIIVDEGKLSRSLGATRALPIEVSPFGHRETRAHLERYGKPSLRERDGLPVRTDSNNLLYDLRIDPVVDARELDARLRQIPGVVVTGFFLGRADLVLVGTQRGVIRLERGPAQGGR